jgi:hypothetical protein
MREENFVALLKLLPAVTLRNLWRYESRHTTAIGHEVRYLLSWKPSGLHCTISISSEFCENHGHRFHFWSMIKFSDVAWCDVSNFSPYMYPYVSSNFFGTSVAAKWTYEQLSCWRNAPNFIVFWHNF